MRTRITVGLALLPFMFAVLYFTPAWVLPAALAAVCAMSADEILCGSGFVTKRRIEVWVALYAVYATFAEFLEFSQAADLFALFLFVTVLFAEGLHDPERVSFPVIGASVCVGVVFPLFLASITRVAGGENGVYAVLLMFIPPFLTDVFALFGGTLFGRRKLAPKLSPNKTVEGTVSGLFASVLFSLVYGAILHYTFDIGINWLALALIGLLGSVAGQFGDLALSFVKRGFGIKDFGSIIPGHGGILDRFDSLFFAAPVIEIIFISMKVLYV